MACSTELPQKAEVVLKEHAQVIHAIAKHGKALYAQTKRKATIFLGIDTAMLEYFGVNHAALSATLLRNWHLPNDTVIPIEYHHHTELPNQYADESALLMLANLMVRAEGFVAVADNAMPEFHEVIATQLNLKLSDLQLLSDEICDKMQTIPHYIKGKAL